MLLRKMDQKICRICTCETSGLLSIFDSYKFSKHNCEIFKVITDCASVQIHRSDGLSELICRSCLSRLSQAYSFKKLCEDSDHKFRTNLIPGFQIELKDEIHECKNNLIANDEIVIKTEISIEETKITNCSDNFTENKPKKPKRQTKTEVTEVQKEPLIRDQNYSVILSSKGKPQFCIEGYKFSFQKKLSGNKKKWICISRGTGCKANVKTEGDEDVIVESALIHNHEKCSLINRQILNNSARRAAIEDVNERPIKIIQKLIHDGATITAKDIMNLRKKIYLARCKLSKR